MGTPKQVVDSYLGNGTYDEWQTMETQESDAESNFSCVVAGCNWLCRLRW
jgi:hypothetical protein